MAVNWEDGVGCVLQVATLVGDRVRLLNPPVESWVCSTWPVYKNNGALSLYVSELKIKGYRPRQLLEAA